MELKKMKNTQTITKIFSTLILISLMTTFVVSTTFAAYNPNPNAGNTVINADYMSSTNTAASNAAQYGNLLNEDYEWDQWIGNTGARTCYVDGPAPDRPDVLWQTKDIPALGTVESGMVAFSGKLFLTSTVDGQWTLSAVHPHTGNILWQTAFPDGMSVTRAFGAAVIYKCDDDHLAVITNQGLAMFEVNNGNFLWNDATINPRAAYFRGVVDTDLKMMFGPMREVPGAPLRSEPYADILTGWDLSNPDVDMGDGNRMVWEYIMDEPGNPLLAAGDGKVFMGSYSSSMVYAIDASNGQKVWETARPDAAGYSAAYADGKLVVGCQSQWIICYDADSGEILWANGDGVKYRAFNVWNGIIAYGRTYWHDLGEGINGATKCLDLETGEELWRARTDMYIGYYQTVAADGKIYGRQSDNSVTTGREAIPTRFSCWDAFTGAEIWSVELDEACAIVAYGCLYMGTGTYWEPGAMSCLSTAFTPEPWSMWRGNVENPGVASSAGPTNLNAGPKWTFTTGGPILSSPAIDEGKLFINSGDRKVYCIDAYTGQDIWTFTTNEPKMTTFGSAPAVIDDKVIIGPDDGNMYCLDTDTGNQLWSINMGPYRAVKVAHGQHNIRSSPIIYNNRIYVGSCHDNTFYCVDLNGNVVWSYETGGPILGSAAIEDNYVYFATWGSTDSAFDDANNIYKFTADGHFVMKFPIRVNMAGVRQSGGFFGTYFSTAATKTPIVKGDRLYWGVDQAVMAVYDATNGDIIFLAEQPYVAGENSHGSCVVAGNRIFSQAGPTMACLSADLVPTVEDTQSSYLGGTNPWYGETIIVEYNDTAPSGDGKSNIWSAWGGWEIFSSVIFSGIGNDARVYCGSESYGMTCWNAEDGMPVGWYTTQGGLGSSPAIWDGKLYFGSQDNNVYCFEDHAERQLAISVSTDKNQVNIEDDESVTVTLQLTGAPNPEEQLTEA
ncbi:MAG: hypothetical protein CW691_01705, partial [Candidatus Bathyarchaeum sp.]